MTLGAKQEEFSRCLGELLTWIYAQGWAVRIGEVHRPKATAEHYAATGKGIKNSAHCRKLAADLFISIDGAVTWNPEDYAAAGVYWKGLHELARHGGDFKNRDAVHFSFIHGGIS